MKSNLSEKKVRLEKLKKIWLTQKSYLYQSFEPQTTVQEIQTLVKSKTETQLKSLSSSFSVAGRLIIKRDLGKIQFFRLTDSTGEIQLIVDQNTPAKLRQQIQNWDRGDIVGVQKSKLILSKTGELSLHLNQAVLLAKSLLPLPNKFQGVKDIELRYRKRYLDLIINPEVKKTFALRTQIISTIRHFLDQHNYLEVTTPILHSVLSGAAAKPFKTQHLALKIPLYLRVAPELYLKRLIVGGIAQVYELGRVFRNEGISYQHNPEFTILEVYQAYGNMETMMNLTESLILHIAKKVFQTQTFIFKNQKFHLNTPFRRAKMIDLVKEITNIDFVSLKDFSLAQKIAQNHGVQLMKHENTIGHVLNIFFEKFVQPKLIQPIFVYEYPRSISPFAKSCLHNPNFTERFELIINGQEYANAFSELNDPFEQEKRLLQQLKEHKLGNEEANEMDPDFIEALSYGMPPTGGLGIGIDRLIMFFTNSSSIKDVIFFPTLKPTS